MESAQNRDGSLFPRHVLDAVIVPPGEKPPPYDFSEIEGGTTRDDNESEEARGVHSTPGHVSETGSNDSQTMTVIDPMHMGPVFFPFGGKLTDQAPFLVAMSVMFFFCGGFLPLIFFLKAWQAKRANDEAKYLWYRKWGCHLAGVPIFVIMVVFFVVIVVVAVTVDNAKYKTS